MTVRLTDIYEPLTFDAAVDEAAIELNAFLASGVMVNDEQITQQASAGGRIGELSYYGPLEINEPNYSNDDPTDLAVPEGIADKMDKWRLAIMNNSWSTMNLSRELALKDPLTAITTKIGGWWATQIERRVIESLNGIMADNVANDSRDMVHDVSTDDVGAPTDAELIGPETVVAAAQTMGDHKRNLRAIAMHSVPHSRLEAQSAITYVSSTQDATIRFEFYLGYRIIVDDSLPAVAGTNRIAYTTILFAEGSLGNGQGRVLVPSEMAREALTGKGGGQDIIVSRRSEVVHPYGFQFLSASIAGESPSLAELGAATEWDRSVHRKIVGIAFLITNG